ncbi:MAG: radical SAM-associated putative lipoprotein [Bacteroidales bacterium]|nr:radical SAM-associated putative lipoprotein [Bacteroidales bacterium]
MKQIKKYFTVKWCALISALLGMLGYSACGSKDDDDMLCLYGQPHADFKAEGSVLNEEGAPIAGVKVYVRYNYGDTTKTDQNGKYVFKANDFGPTRSFWVMAEDPSGVYAADSVQVNADYKGGDGDWYVGSYSTTHDFTLKKKPAQPETPELPSEPEEPETPEQPSDPESPEQPSEPETETSK